MLVLARKQAESIRIANEIEVVVLAIRGGKVRLGINCPRDVPVHRSEIQERIDRSQTQSPKDTTDSHAETTQRTGRPHC